MTINNLESVFIPAQFIIIHVMWCGEIFHRQLTVSLFFSLFRVRIWSCGDPRIASKSFFSLMVLSLFRLRGHCLSVPLVASLFGQRLVNVGLSSHPGDYHELIHPPVSPPTHSEKWLITSSLSGISTSTKGEFLLV